MEFCTDWLTERLTWLPVYNDWKTCVEFKYNGAKESVQVYQQLELVFVSGASNIYKGKSRQESLRRYLNLLHQVVMMWVVQAIPGGTPADPVHPKRKSSKKSANGNGDFNGQKEEGINWLRFTILYAYIFKDFRGAMKIICKCLEQHLHLSCQTLRSCYYVCF